MKDITNYLLSKSKLIFLIGSKTKLVISKLLLCQLVIKIPECFF